MENLALTELSARQSIVTPGRDTQIDVAMRNYGSRPLADGKLQLFVDGQKAAESPVNARAGGQASVSFTHRFETPGDHWLEARFSDDPLPVDNHRWLSVPVRESIPVLCISGKPEAAGHVALALNPESSSEPPRVRARVEPESAILETNLAQYACIFICNVGRFGEDETRMLQQYVAAGGGLVVALGDLVQPENYNSQLAGDSPPHQLLPARLQEIVSNDSYTLDPLDYRHPIVEPFRGFERSGLLTTPIWRYYRLQPLAAMHPRTVLALDSGDPLIVEASVGRGHCVLIATSMSSASFDRSSNPPTPWTAMTTWPSFPPLVQEILEYAIQGLGDSRNVEVGEPIGDDVPRQQAEASLTVLAPGDSSGQGDRVALADSGEQRSWTYDRTWVSGVYEARFGAPWSRSEFFTANVNTRESNPARFDAELLPSQFQQASAGQSVEEAFIPALAQSQYYRLFLSLMLGLLLLETFYAWWIGSDRR
jgi:hypothetical protein